MTTSDLARWLADLKLDAYYEAFVQNHVDFDVLTDLTEADLEKILIPLGDRKRLMKAIDALREHSGNEPATKEGSLSSPGVVRDPAQEPPRRTQTGEVRHLTLVFVDLVDSTALSERLDLEEYRDAITSFQICCTEIIRKFHGFLAMYVGDGILAYFGYPSAAEDDVERAVTAGLEISRAVGRIEVGQGIGIEARVGIATGRVLISDLIGKRIEIRGAAMGGIPNLAARLQSIATPGTVVVSDATQRLLGNRFDCSNHGMHTLKGFSDPVSVWQVDRVRPALSRFDSRQRGPMSPFVGRDEEAALLSKRWRLAVSGEGQVVLLSGEAGIGKSRLSQSLCNYIKDDPHIHLHFQCSPYHTRSAFYPLIAELTHAAKFQDEDSNLTKLQKLEQLLGPVIEDIQETMPLFAELLSIAAEGRFSDSGRSPESAKDRTIRALLNRLFSLAERKPVIVVFEDLHWIDPSSEEFLDYLIERISSKRILLICTYRPEFEAPWVGRSGVLSFGVNRLTHRHALAMVEALSSEHPLPTDVARSIVAKAEGVPLFLEELTRTLVESEALRKREGRTTEDGRTNIPALPSTLKDLLMAKLDSLPEARDVVAACAAIGRVFAFKLLATVSDLPENELKKILGRLTEAKILVQRGRWPDTRYSFRHALIQEAAYDTMLSSRARALHARIARALESGFPDVVTSNPEIVAQHCSQGAMPREAREFWAAAGRLAIEHSANQEAIADLEAALRENEKLDDSEDRVRSEIALREMLCVPLEGRYWGSDDIERNLNRLRQLQMEHGDDYDLFFVLHGLCGTHLIGGNVDRALASASEMAAISEKLDDAALIVLSQHALGMSRFFLGDLGSAIGHYAAAIRLRHRASDEAIRKYYVADPKIVDLCMQAWAYVLNEEPANADRAIKYANRILAAGEHEFSKAYGFSILASVYQTRDNADTALDYASRALELSRRNNFRYWEAWSRIVRGWAMVASGDGGPGVDELKAGLDAYLQTGSKQIVSYAKTLLADAYLRTDRFINGLSVIEDIEATQDNSQIQFYRKVTDRVGADLRRASDPVDCDIRS